MPPRIALALLVALLVRSLSYAGSACCEFCPDQYQQEGQFPYFEVIRTRRLIPDTSVVSAEGWKRIFESCAQAERVNITASTDVTVVARAFLQLTDLSTPDMDIEYRWLLDDVPVGATFRSRTSDRFPHADDINIVLPHVAPGRHRVAIEARVAGEGKVDLRLLFITAQGFPAVRFPADSRIDAHGRTIGTDWSLAGPVLDLNSPEAARVYFQAYIEGSPGDAFDVRFVIDDAPQPPFHVVIPAGGGVALWDHGADPIAAGAHTIRLEARSATMSTLTLEQVEAASAPVTLQNKTLPTLEATNSGSFGIEHQPLNCLILSAGGDSGGTGGLGGTPVCGKYDLLIDATLPAAPIDDNTRTPLDEYTVFGDGYVEIDNRSDKSGIVALTIEAIYEDGRAANCNALIETANVACPSPNTCATADFTLVEFAVPPGRSQKFFYVDPIHWGSAAPNRIRVWARSGNCFGIPAVDVAYGRSRIGMQLVPAGAAACFSAHDFGRAAAPALTASLSGSKVLLQTQVAAPFFGSMDILRATGDGPFSLLMRLPDTTRSFIDFTVRSGVMYRYQVRAVENSSNPQLPYSSACGTPSPEVRITVPPIASRRRAVH